MTLTSPTSPVSEAAARLRGLYGERLKGVYVYGSQARRDAGPESDIDLLVVLDSIYHYAAEVDRCSKDLAELSLAYDTVISAVFVGEAEWESRDSPFLRNVRREAVAA